MALILALSLGQVQSQSQHLSPPPRHCLLSDVTPAPFPPEHRAHGSSSPCLSMQQCPRTGAATNAPATWPGRDWSFRVLCVPGGNGAKVMPNSKRGLGWEGGRRQGMLGNR